MAQFAKRSFSPTPPDKGSFPLDHTGLCKDLMTRYMSCLRQSFNDNGACREQIKAYLECRMEHNLMTKEEWSKLGLDDVGNKADVAQKLG